MHSFFCVVLLTGLLLALPSVFAQLQVSSLVINEIHYDEADKTEAAEFIEIYNTTDAPVILEGWKISGGVDFYFPPASRIESGDYLVVAQDEVIDGVIVKYGAPFTPAVRGRAVQMAAYAHALSIPKEREPILKRQRLDVSLVANVERSPTRVGVQVNLLPEAGF